MAHFDDDLKQLEDALRNLVENYKNIKLVPAKIGNIYKLERLEISKSARLWVRITKSNKTYVLTTKGMITPLFYDFINKHLGYPDDEGPKGKLIAEGHKEWRNHSLNSIEIIIKEFNNYMQDDSVKNIKSTVNPTINAPTCIELRNIAKEIKKNTGIAQPQPENIFSIWEQLNNHKIDITIRKQLIKKCFRKK